MWHTWSKLLSCMFIDFMNCSMSLRAAGHPGRTVSVNKMKDFSVRNTVYVPFRCLLVCMNNATDSGVRLASSTTHDNLDESRFISTTHKLRETTLPGQKLHTTEMSNMCDLIPNAQPWACLPIQYTMHRQ